MCNCKKKDKKPLTEEEKLLRKIVKMKKATRKQELENLQDDFADHYQEIDKVKLNDPGVVVWLKDGRKGVAVADTAGGDKYDHETGFWCAYAKALRQKKPIMTQLTWSSQDLTPYIFNDRMTSSHYTMANHPLVTAIKNMS